MFSVLKQSFYHQRQQKIRQKRANKREKKRAARNATQGENATGNDMLSNYLIDVDSFEDCKDKDGNPLPQWVCRKGDPDSKSSQ